MHLTRSARAVIDDLGKAQRAKTLDAAVVDLVIQIACLALLAYWTLVLLQPLLSIILWSVILAVLLYQWVKTSSPRCWPERVEEDRDLLLDAYRAVVRQTLNNIGDLLFKCFTK
jgi:membrane protein implicated in regulation of membrane protease activity